MRPRLQIMKRCCLAGATAFLAINIWTGAPLLALWVGSRVAGQTVLSMRAVIVVVAVLTALVMTMAALLVWLNGVYRELAGSRSARRRSPWLQSMRGESQRELDEQEGITPIERIVTACVYVAVVTFVVWFLFFAGSPVPPPTI